MLLVDGLSIPTVPKPQSAAAINQQAARQSRQAAQQARQAARPAKPPKGPLPVTPPVPGLNTPGQQTTTGYDSNGNPLPVLTTTDVMMNGMQVPQGQQLSPMLATQMVSGAQENPETWNFMGPQLMQPLVANFETDRHDLQAPAPTPNGLTIPPR